MRIDPQKFIAQKIEEIKNKVGDQKAVVACSGGVDSTTCTILAHKALGERLLAVFIDDGLMREGEPEQVTKFLRKLGVKTKLLRAQRRFFKALKGKIDPEEKRKAFREVFYQVLGDVVKKEKAKFLIQGTIKVDVIEATGGIKTQHNVLEQVGIDPKKYGFKVIEPLKTLYKPEVRRVAKSLGLPKEIYERMAFPGPGLALRVIGEVTPKRVALVRQVDKIVKEEIMPLRKDPEHPYQAFAVLLKDKATGVTKEGVRRGNRVFGDIIVIRAFDSHDAMTLTPTKISWKVLQRIQKRITTEVPSVVRVLYDLTPKPPATIEYI